MRTFIIALIVLVSTAANAQLHVQGGLGMSTAKKAVVNIEAGYGYKHITLSGGFDTHTSSMVDNPCIFYSTLGYNGGLGERGYVSIGGGIAKHLYTTDLTKEYSPNKTSYIGKITVGREIQQSGCFMSLMFAQTKGYSIVTVGLTGIW